MSGQLIEFFSARVVPFSLEISLGLLLLLWIIFFIRYPVLLLKPVIKELKYFFEFLSKLDNSSDINRSQVEYFINDAGQKSFLQPIWADYVENWSIQPHWDEYFNKYSLVDVPTKRNKTVSVPSFLTTIGLVAAFFCFFLRIVTAHPDADLTQILYPAVGEVAIVALFAIFLSYLFDRIIRSMFNKADALAHEINKIIRRKIPLTHEYTKLERIISSLDNMTNRLANYAQHIADMQQNGMNQLVDAFLEGLNSKMGNQLQELGETFQNLSITQLQNVSRTESCMEELIRGAEIQKQINDASEAIISSIANYHEHISNCSQSLSVSLDDLRLLSQTLNDIVTFNSDMLDNIKQEKQSLKEEYKKSIHEIYDSIQKYQSDTSDKLEYSLKKFSDISEEMISKLEGSVFNSMDSWTNSHKIAVQNMEEYSKDMNIASKEISLHLSELSSGLKETMKEFAEVVEKGTKKTITEFDEGLAEITQRLSNTLLEIRDSIDDLPVIIDSLGKRLE